MSYVIHKSLSHCVCVKDDDVHFIQHMGHIAWTCVIKMCCFICVYHACGCVPVYWCIICASYYKHAFQEHVIHHFMQMNVDFICGIQ